MGRARVFPAKSTIAQEVDADSRVYRLISGQALCQRALPDGRTQIISRLFKGDVVGINLLGDTLSSSLLARTTAAAQSIPREQLLQLAQADHNVALWLIRHADREHARLLNWLTVLNHGTALEKIAVLLLNLCGRVRPPARADARPIRVPLTQREISDHIGLTPPHVSRTLATLRRLGAVNTGHGTIEVVAPDLLAAAARTMAGLTEGTATADFGRCFASSSGAADKETPARMKTWARTPTTGETERIAIRQY
jgi:CRP-like cAMP-binding protein